MYTNIYDINFSEKDGFERRLEEDYTDCNNNIYRIFIYKNIMFSVCYPENIFNILKINILHTVDNNDIYFPKEMKEFADISKFERMDVRDFNLNDFLRSLNVLVNISKTF